MVHRVVGVEPEESVDRVAVDVQGGDAGRRRHERGMLGLGQEVSDEGRLARSRLSGEEEVVTAVEEFEGVAELVGEDHPVRQAVPLMGIHGPPPSWR